MSDDDRDWSVYDPEPRDIGAFVRRVVSAEGEGAWDEDAEVADVSAIASPVGWFVSLVENESDGEEAKAYARLAEASLRVELGQPMERPAVAGYRSASWLDAVAVALGADRIVAWDVGGTVVVLLPVPVLDSLDLWLVTCDADAASMALPELLADEFTPEPGEDPLVQTVRWLAENDIDLGLEPGATLDGWFPDDVAADDLERLTPFAIVDGAGSVAATWTDDAGRTLVVLLGSEGEAHVLANSSLDFARLLGVGYDEISDAGGAVDGAFGPLVAALVRAWVTDTFDVTVPREWAVGGPDEFSDWMARLRGNEPAPSTPLARSGGLDPDAVTGDIAVLLDALGREDGLARIAGMLDLPASTTAGHLERRDVHVNLARRGPTQVLVDLADPEGYPRRDELLGDVNPLSSLPDVVSRWGEPERQDPGGAWARWLVGDRSVHLAFDGEGIFQVTAILNAP